MSALKVLIQVDVQNVFYGSRNFTHGQSRVDYEKLVEFIKHAVVEHAQEDNRFLASIADVATTVFGYVVQTPRYKGMNFFAFLRRIGYVLRVRTYPEDLEVEDEYWRGTVSNMIQMDYLQYAPDFDYVVIVSGSGVYEPVFKASRQNWPNVKRCIAAFKDTLHATYGRRENLVCLAISLDEQVLRS